MCFFQMLSNFSYLLPMKTRFCLLISATESTKVIGAQANSSTTAFLRLVTANWTGSPIGWWKTAGAPDGGWRVTSWWQRTTAICVVLHLWPTSHTFKPRWPLLSGLESPSSIKTKPPYFAFPFCLAHPSDWRSCIVKCLLIHCWLFVTPHFMISWQCLWGVRTGQSIWQTQRLKNS